MEPRIRFSTPTIDLSTIPPNYYRLYHVYYPLESLTCEKEYTIDESFDVYSYGFVLFFLFEGEIDKKIRFLTEWVKFISEGVNLEKPSEIPDILWELVQRCWSRDPSKRPSFKEIVEMLRTGDFFNDSKINIKSLHEYQDRVDPKSAEELQKKCI